jgi:hypothetical protein
VPVDSERVPPRREHSLQGGADGTDDCVYATSQLNGGRRIYYNNANRSADDLWQILRSHCLSYRTFHPMTAWTYATGDDAPDHVDYGSAHVVGSHCYTVLGWAYRNCKRWIVLRNPWGTFEATASRPRVHHLDVRRELVAADHAEEQRRRLRDGDRRIQEVLRGLRHRLLTRLS